MDGKRALSSSSPKRGQMMDEQELQWQWQTLLCDERDKRDAARVLNSDPPTREFRKAVRDLWGAYEAGHFY
jgi:hypothetical protein